MDLNTALDKLGILGGFFPIGTFLLCSWGAFTTPQFILYPAFLGFIPEIIRFNATGGGGDAGGGGGGGGVRLPYCALNSSLNILCPGNETFYCVDQSDKMQVNSLAVQWDLACDKSYLIPFCKSFIFVGYLLGCTFIGAIMDGYGRKRLTAVSILMTGVFGVITAFVDGVIPFLVLRIICGACTLVAYMGGYIIICEMVAKQHRGPFAMACTIPWAIATSMLPLITYYLPSAKAMTLAISIPNFLFAGLYYFLTPESPVWMLANGKRVELENFLIKEGKNRRNQVLFTPGFLEAEEQKINKQKTESTNAGGKPGILGIIRSKMYLKYTILMCLVWNIDAAFYHGLNFSSASGDSPYVTFCLNGISELIGYVAAILITRFCGRKKPTILLHIGAAVFVFLIPLIRLGGRNGTNIHVNNAIIACNMASKFCITITFVLVWLYAGEVVHTNLRSSVLSICEFMSRVGSFLAPFLMYLGEITSAEVPEVLVGVLALLAAAMMLPFPETGHKPLPNTKEEVRRLGKGDELDREQNHNLIA